MLTPERTFVFEGELYKAGITRVVPDHRVTASEFVDLLKPAYDKDATVEVMRFLERRLAARTGTGSRGRREGAKGSHRERPYWWLGPWPGRET